MTVSEMFTSQILYSNIIQRLWQTPRKRNKFVEAAELICDQIFHSPVPSFHSFLRFLPISHLSSSLLLHLSSSWFCFFFLFSLSFSLSQVFGVSTLTFCAQLDGGLSCWLRYWDVVKFDSSKWLVRQLNRKTGEREREREVKDVKNDKRE